MLCADRIMIGTANWGKPYRGHQVPIDEIRKILDMCQCCGITWLDCARAYECDDIVDKYVNNSFNIQYKVLNDDPVPDWVYTIISHDNIYRGCGSSLYEPEPGMHGICQIPYSIVDRRWEDYLEFDSVSWQTRSVFCRGKVFKSCHSTFSRIRLMARHKKMAVGELCLLFCLLNRHIDKVVIGVNSASELKENLRVLHKLDGFGIDDLNIIDLRNT